MASLGYDLKSDVIFEMINHLNREGYTEVNFEQFASFMATKPRPEDRPEDIKKIFDLFDEKGEGVISQKQLQRICRELGYNISSEELSDILKFSTTKDDGQLTFDEFYTIMTKSAFP